MCTARWRRILPGIALFTGLMAMALSCGGVQEAVLFSDHETTTQEFQESAASVLADDSADRRQAAPPLATQPALAEVATSESAPVSGGASAAPFDGSSDGSSTTNSQNSGSQNSVNPQRGRQLIVEAWISLEVSDIDSAARQVENLAAQRGGWVESADVLGEGGYRNASINIRVPADQLNGALVTLRGLGEVSDEGVSSTDVTDRLIDNEARMSAWSTQEERLIKLLENAATLEDVIDIERRISEVRADIENVAATQRNLENRVAASLIKVSLHLPGRFAADPPYGTLTLEVGDPMATANTISGQVAALNGWIGSRREYQDDRGPVVVMSAFVLPADLAGLMDYAGRLGEPSERRLTSVGPTPVGDAYNARLSLTIRSNVDSAATLALSASDPITTAGAIRARAESLGGYADSWNETRWDNGEQERVHMELIVNGSDLRDIMQFGTTMGKAEHWEFLEEGQSPQDGTPNARLTVTVATGPGWEAPWAIIAAIAGGVVILAGGVVVALIIWRRVRRNRRSVAGINRRQSLAPDGDDDARENGPA